MSQAVYEQQVILNTLSQLIEPLREAIPGQCEVVLHDLNLLPNSIVAVAGDLTGRAVGGPATDHLMRSVARGDCTNAFGYMSRHPDGYELRSSTFFVRSSDEKPIAALCINTDIRGWHLAADLVAAMLPSPNRTDTHEEFPGDLDNLAHKLLGQVIAEVGIPISLMKKRHKIAVVRELRNQGFFLMRDAVETAAHALDVTRFTVYNYLNEIERDDSPEQGAG